MADEILVIHAATSSRLGFTLRQNFGPFESTFVTKGDNGTLLVLTILQEAERGCGLRVAGNELLNFANIDAKAASLKARHWAYWALKRKSGPRSKVHSLSADDCRNLRCSLTTFR